MNRFLLSLLLYMLGLSMGFAQQKVQPEQLTGSWSGTIQAGEQQIQVIFHINTSPEGGVSGTFDVPAQGAKGLPVQQAKLLQDSLFLDMKNLGIVYSGKITGPSTITGQWQQAGQSFPLVLGKGADSVVTPKRPQEPQKPYPYLEREVSVQNKEAGITLAGTLTLPQGKGPFPAVLLLTGSGPQDRDETILGHKPFLVIADYLTRQGIAVLRLDDRGVGKSGGNFATATTQDFTSDARAAYAFLKTHKDINSKKIGLLGHSEGALIATQLAATDKSVAFVAFLAGIGVSGTELLLAQNEALFKEIGAPQETIQKFLKVRRAQFKAAASTTDSIAVATTIKQLEEDAKAKFSVQERQRLGLSPENTQALVTQLTTPWVRNFLSYHPAPDLQKLTMPVLAVTGSKDLQAVPHQNLPAIEKALKIAGNKTVTIKELPNLNHLLQTATTGMVSEYGTIEETIAPVALETIGNWMRMVIK
ncbi:alpha/beta hydrolase family protein [Pontibacter sp. 13R65]|uniref:alpha/beta hydrolase family protein n=1 Tax=Pontibacter sp. 13R65 TaxID=3127458 RepID=UPI00301D4164